MAIVTESSVCSAFGAAYAKLLWPVVVFVMTANVIKCSVSLVSEVTIAYRETRKTLVTQLNLVTIEKCTVMVFRCDKLCKYLILWIYSSELFTLWQFELDIV